MKTKSEKIPSNKDQEQLRQVQNAEGISTGRYLKPPASSIQLFTDNRPITTTQRKQLQTINKSPQVKKGAEVQSNIDSGNRQLSQRQKLSTIFNRRAAQLKKNQDTQGTGLPDNLKTGAENLSGMSLDNVKVHYNSSKPAELHALAYAQGTDIHLGPGQEKHLPHEAWHVIQQQQGRVKPTMQMKGRSINDDTALETEADVMGMKSITSTKNTSKSTIQQEADTTNQKAIQRKSIREEVSHLDSKKDGVYSGSVDRYEYADKAAYNDRIGKDGADKRMEKSFFWANVKVRYDSNRGIFEVPVSVNFINNNNDGETHCHSGADKANPLPQDKFDKTVSRFMSTIPDSLNNWFNIHFENPGLAQSKLSTIPIQVVMTEDKSNADFNITISENEGRSGVQFAAGGGGNMTLCESGADQGVNIHEAAHMVLGTGDEYLSREPASKKRLGEYSWMAQDAPERLRGFYERHFQFATAFMNSTFPGCGASLVSGSREPAKEITPQVSVGGLINDDGSKAAIISMGLQFGIPLTTMRELSLLIEPKISLVGLDSEHQMSSILMGLRAGLQYRKNIGTIQGGPVNFTSRISAEAGGGLNFSDESESLPNKKLFPYLESSASLGIEIEQFNFGLEAGRGVMLPGGASPDLFYYKLGVRLGVNF